MGLFAVRVMLDHSSPLRVQGPARLVRQARSRFVCVAELFSQACTRLPRAPALALVVQLMRYRLLARQHKHSASALQVTLAPPEDRVRVFLLCDN